MGGTGKCLAYAVEIKRGLGLEDRGRWWKNWKTVEEQEELEELEELEDSRRRTASASNGR